MNSKAKLLTLVQTRLIASLLLTFALSSVSVGTVIAQTKLTNQSKLFANGIGQVRVGMTVSQASKAAGTRLVGDPPNKYCYYVKPEWDPKNVGFMVTEGRVSRVDVWRDSKITTLKGAKIGDTEARIKSLYPGQIKVTPHNYVSGGHYLTFVPKDQSDENYRVVFETDGKRVTQFRSGKLPEVEFVEGCS
ncbi:hypothetical protein NIES25_36670 [Nostoc linckia NIES-25]|nr:hypothetical protein NIES25_36670 [Nostoc linckia NIES-25]